MPESGVRRALELSKRLHDLSFCIQYDLWNPLVNEANLQETAKQIYPQESGYEHSVTLNTIDTQ